ncbi:hypothetical protein SRHO_G00017150 [Serrasalmus rhombeus]
MLESPNMRNEEPEAGALGVETRTGSYQNKSARCTFRERSRLPARRASLSLPQNVGQRPALISDGRPGSNHKHGPCYSYRCAHAVLDCGGSLSEE